MKQRRRKPDIQKWSPITTRSGAKTKRNHQGSFHRIVPPIPLHSVSFNIILYGDYWCCVLCINMKFIRLQVFFYFCGFNNTLGHQIFFLIESNSYFQGNVNLWTMTLSADFPMI